MKETALVTGASRGIGRAVALRLAREGFSIWLNYKSNHEAAQEAAAAIESLGVSCTLLPFDVANNAACKEALAPLLAESVPFAVVNNAGFSRDTLLSMMTEDEWHSVTRVHLDGFFNVTGTVLPHMQRKRRGRIINIASTSGETGVGGQVNYSAAKAGLIGATRSLAVEVAKRNILVNAVAPGFIETEMTENFPLEKALAYIPLGRIGKPEDVAEVVAFLASEGAGYVTGQVISVNGGMFTG